jgi:hypothetical protein
MWTVIEMGRRGWDCSVDRMKCTFYYYFFRRDCKFFCTVSYISLLKSPPTRA